jgi:hypothetical protein
MMPMSTAQRIDAGDAPPVAVGGVGGSGTRLVAAWLRHLGLETGSDLNASEDCLWFTLLFKHHDALNCNDREFDLAVRALVAGLRRGMPLSSAMYRLVQQLAHSDRPQHDVGWLRERAESLMLAAASAPVTKSRWGWKEPNTHMVIDRLMRSLPTLRYVHVVRHGVEVACGENQNQVRFWGPIVLGRDGPTTPARSLAFWCRVQQRMQRLMGLDPQRIYWLDYNALCREPDSVSPGLCRFLGLDPGRGLAAFRDLVRPPPPRIASPDPGCFDPDDLAYVRSLGYGL